MAPNYVIQNQTFSQVESNFAIDYFLNANKFTPAKKKINLQMLIFLS